MRELKRPDIVSSMEDMDAGILLNKLSTALADVAIGVVEHNKKGKLVLTLDLDRIGETSQVNVSYKIAYQKPTMRGKMSEEATTSTPMYINRNGFLSVMPEDQLDIFNNQENKAHG